MQCDAVGCSALQCAVDLNDFFHVRPSLCAAVWCSVVQCGAVWCSVVQCVGALNDFLHVRPICVCCSGLQCFAAYSSVVQCALQYALQWFGVLNAFSCVRPVLCAHR